MKEEIVKADVLCIGGGPAGIWAANRAKEFVDISLTTECRMPPDRFRP